MTKAGWNDYIDSMKMSLKYLRKELDEHNDDADIRSDWNTTVAEILKDILRETMVHM